MNAMFKLIMMLSVMMLAGAAPSTPLGGGISDIVNRQEMCDKLALYKCTFTGGYKFRYSVFDPVTGGCKCSLLPSEYLIASRCADIKCPIGRAEIHYVPRTNECYCTSTNSLDEAFNTYVIDEKITAIDAALEAQIVNLTALSMTAVKLASPLLTLAPQGDLHLRKEALKYLQEEIEFTASAVQTGIQRKTKWIQAEVEKSKRQIEPPTSSIPPDVVPTFIPPPKTDVTPALINQSLAVQPQDTATIGSVIPQLNEGKIMYAVQFNGQVAEAIRMNASISFPCGLVGSAPEPNIKVVPKYVHQGAPQTTVANCLCFAVNTPNPNVIQYWIHHDNGNVYSLAGSNKVSDVDKINTNRPIALNLVAVPANQAKRGTGMVEPSMLSATMTEEACDAIICNDSHERAMFNPFTHTCFCAGPAFVEDNPSAWVGAQ